MALVDMVSCPCAPQGTQECCNERSIQEVALSIACEKLWRKSSFPTLLAERLLCWERRNRRCALGRCCRESDRRRRHDGSLRRRSSRWSGSLLWCWRFGCLRLRRDERKECRATLIDRAIRDARLLEGNSDKRDGIDGKRFIGDRDGEDCQPVAGRRSGIRFYIGWRPHDLRGSGGTTDAGGIAVDVLCKLRVDGDPARVIGGRGVRGPGTAPVARQPWRGRTIVVPDLDRHGRHWITQLSCAATASASNNENAERDKKKKRAALYRERK